MKFFLSILFSASILVSGTGIRIATHYCGGDLAATRVSLTGVLASCGMEGCDIDHSTLERTFTNLCCKNHISSYFLSDYSGSSVLAMNQPVTEINQLFNIHVIPGCSFGTLINRIANPKPPPGALFSSHISSPSLCIFRI
jgi:hypothetical protein